MFGTHIPRLRILAMFALTLIFASAAYGFAAANTVAVTAAGDGSNTISGYDVTGVTYTLSTPDPTNITKVSFRMDPIVAGAPVNPPNVRVSLVNGSTTFFGCTYTAVATPNPNYDCTITSPVTAASANSLRVVAWQ
jgi:hypothetical protein